MIDIFANVSLTDKSPSEIGGEHKVTLQDSPHNGRTLLDISHRDPQYLLFILRWSGGFTKQMAMQFMSDPSVRDRVTKYAEHNRREKMIAEGLHPYNTVVPFGPCADMRLIDVVSTAPNQFIHILDNWKRCDVKLDAEWMQESPEVLKRLNAFDNERDWLSHLDSGGERGAGREAARKTDRDQVRDEYAEAVDRDLDEGRVIQLDVDDMRQQMGSDPMDAAVDAKLIKDNEVARIKRIHQTALSTIKQQLGRGQISQEEYDHKQLEMEERAYELTMDAIAEYEDTLA